jgi:hypothetical protein
MSYNTWATREGVVYTARVAEPLPSGAFCVDILDSNDGSPFGLDSLFLKFDDDVLEYVKFIRHGNEFQLLETMECLPSTSLSTS